jgi:DNA-binding response OmpR family regulator
MRVLVVEDEVELARLIQRGLMADGHLADVAASGEDARWMAASTPYTAICLDVNLPGIEALFGAPGAAWRGACPVITRGSADVRRASG